jgi:copper oxidase (laccase) domain-containing protein
MNMILETFVSYLSSVLFMTAVLTALTNIVVEVFKGLLTKVPTALLVIVTAQCITFPAMMAAARFAALSAGWEYIFGTVILGIIVAYAAMGNFDKLKQIIEKLKEHSREA